MPTNVPIGWQQVSLNDLVQLIRNGTTAFQSKETSPYPVTRIETISEGVIDRARVGYLLRPESSYLLEPGDILYSHINSIPHIGKVAIYEGGEPLYHGMNLMLIRPNPQEVSPKYLFLILASEQSRAYAKRECKSAINQASLGQNQILSLSVRLPPLPEQRRIAEVLDAADEAIRQTERLIAKLKAVKAGLLHDLLTRGLDEHGRLRDPQAHPEQFKDSPVGRIPREWKVASVDSEFEITTGFALGPHRRPRKNRRRYLRVANVLRERILLDDIAELEASDGEMVGRVLQKDDLLIVEGHANPNEIGRCARVPVEATGLTFQNHLFRLRSRRVDSRFALAWLNGEWVQAYWRCLCGTSSGLNTINRTMLKAVPIPILAEWEQREIATILDTHNTRIHAEEAALAKLRQVKRGLMDDLLTGQVRV